MSNNIWKREFDGLFSVSEVKRIFKKENSTIQPFDIEKQINEYDLRNQNIYDLETKELISIGKQTEYNTVFVLKLMHIYVLDVFPFLNHHYQKTSDKKKFIQYVEYGALTQIKSEGVKNAIQGWLNEGNDKKSQSNNSEIDIVSKIYSQLSKILEFLNEDIRNKQVICNYNICEDECKFLDKHELQTYITKTKIENTAFLKMICFKCIEVIELCHINCFDLPYKMLKEQFVHQNISTSLDFRTIYLSNQKFTLFNTDEGKKDFFDRFNFNTYQIADIANRCSLILNWITASFPEINTDSLKRLNNNLIKKNDRLHDEKLNNTSILENEKNDFIKSTIEDYLEPITEYFKEEDYNLLVAELLNYFNTDSFSNSEDTIKIIGKPNVKKIGWQLKEIYNNCITDNRKLSIEYLRFGKERISIFKTVNFDENNYLKSNLYKYYNTKV